jgi:hypothetical protein
MPYGPSSILGEVLRNKHAADIIRKYIPGLEKELMPVQCMHGTIEQVSSFVADIRTNPAARDALYSELATVTESGQASPTRAEEPPLPSSGYESADVPVGSAALIKPTHATRWRTFELEFHGPGHGNPYTDVAVSAEFRLGERSLKAHGFYDGIGVYRIRFMPDQEGTWTFRTSSNARSLDGIAGDFDCGPAAGADRGPVRVHGGFHFRYADDTRFLPLGTTAYAWTHQGDGLEEQTLQTLADSPFNKIRMCVFPKSFVHNTNEPPQYPFAGSPTDGWDFLRPNHAYFRHLEQRIAQLAELGIQADVILFHPYDRWRFSDMGAAGDDCYLRYVIARLAAYPNVWWSLANEYDLMWAKHVKDWHRFAALIREHDPHDHLISIHNWVEIWDNTTPWVTHASIQSAPTNTAEWRTRWHKPVLIDECGYEGDIEWGWGNLMPQELVRRCWEGVVRGGYVTHGECFLAEDDVLWWAKGGVLKGESTARLRLLRNVLDELPADVDGIDPLPSDFDTLVGGVEDRYYLIYFGHNQPRQRTLSLRLGTRYRADVIDTWNMTVTGLPGSYEGTFTLPLPARPYVAIRLQALEE